MNFNVFNAINSNTVENNKTLGGSLAKLSSGLKINKASDDASGLSISDKLRTQASGIKQGIDNANSAVSMLQIADKAIAEVSNILDIIKQKSIQMSTYTTSEQGKVAIKNEILKLISNVNTIACGTNYNGTPLLNGCASPFDFFVTDSSDGVITANIDSITPRNLGKPDPFKLSGFINGFQEINEPVVLNIDANYTFANAGDTVAQANATDADGSGIVYSIDDDTNGYYNIDSSTGLVTLTSAGATYIAANNNLPDFTLTAASTAGETSTQSIVVNPSDTTTTFDESTLAGASGVVRVNFDWDSNLGVEIDGYVVEPNGSVTGWATATFAQNLPNAITFDNTGPTSTGGVVDVVTSSAGNENHVWVEDNGNLDGTWQVFVRNFSNIWPNDEPININVTIIENGNAQVITVPIPTSANEDFTDGQVPVATFEYPNSTTTSGSKTTLGGTYSSVATSTSSCCSYVNATRDDTDLTTQANTLMGVVDEALNQLNLIRGEIGSTQNQLESATRNLMTSYTNIKSAESVIRDVDYAEESATFNKSNIISQAGTFTQTQANETMQNVLKLLK